MDEPASTAARARGRLAQLALWSYVAALLVVVAVLHGASDRWWIATLLLFAPRWIWGLPLGVFALLAANDRRLLWPFGLAVAIVVGPVVGLCLPWRVPLASGTPVLTLRALSCNHDNRALDLERFRALLSEARPSIVVMQDVWMPSLEGIFSSDDWHVHASDGMCLASRFPILAVDSFDTNPFGPGLGRARCYALETPAGIVHVFNLHLATPRWGLLAAVLGERDGGRKLQFNSELRRRQSSVISRQASTLVGPVLIAGDFNTPIESTIYRESWSAYENAFSVAGTGRGHTHLTKHTSVRIDHILASGEWRVRRCWIGPDVGSAHRPIVADIAWHSLPSHGEARAFVPPDVTRR